MFLLKNNHVFFFVLLLPIFLLVLWFSDGMIKGTGESGLPFYNIAKEYRITSYAWIPDGLGNSSFTTVAGNFFYGFFYLLDFLGLPKFLQQGVFFYLSFFLSGLGMIYLCKFFIPNIRSRYILFAIFFYWFNPISAFNVWNRFLNNFILFWAVLPLIYYFYLNCLIKKKYLDLLPLTFLIFMSSYAFSSISLLLLLFILFSLTFIFWVLINKKFGYFSFGFKYFLVFSVLFVFSNLWWIINLFSFKKSSNYVTVISSFFSSEGNLSALASLSERIANLSSIFRLAHEEAVNSLIWAKIYNFPPIKILMFLPIFVVFILVLRTKLQKLMKLLFFLFLSFAFLAKGSNPPFSELFLLPFERLFFFQSFRNSFEKFSLVLILIVSILVVVAIDTIKNSKLKKLTEFLFVFLLIVYMYPFFTGKVLSSNMGFNNNAYDNYSVKVPEYYLDVNNFLSKNTSHGRTLVLPIGGEGMTYTWDYPYSGVELSNAIFNKPVISFNTIIPYYHEIVKVITNYQTEESFLSILKYLNVKYILLRDDIDYELREMPSPLVIGKILDDLEKQGKVRLVFYKGRIKVYEVNINYYLPKFYVAEKIVSSNSNDLVLMEDIFRDGELTLSYLSIFDEVRSNYNLIFPLKSSYFEQINDEIPEILNLETLTTEEILSKLFHAKHLPGSPIYPLVRYKEFIQLKRQPDSTSKIIFQIGILGKRASEIYKLRMQKDDDKVVKNIEDDYVSLFLEMIPTMKDLFYQDNALSALLRESLFLQLELFSRANSPLYSKIKTLIYNGFDQANHLQKCLTTTRDGFYTYQFSVESPGYYKVINLLIDDQVCLNDSQVELNNQHIFLEAGNHEISIFSDEERKIALLQEKNYPTKTSTVLKSYERVNPTEYNVKISKADNKEEILVFSELFDSNWEAYYDSGELIDAGKHLKVNVYANAWVIDRAGDYQIKIIYTPQKSLEIGKKVSLTTVTILLTVYILLVLRHKKYHVN